MNSRSPAWYLADVLYYILVANPPVNTIIINIVDIQKTEIETIVAVRQLVMPQLGMIILFFKWTRTKHLASKHMRQSWLHLWLKLFFLNTSLWHSITMGYDIKNKKNLLLRLGVGCSSRWIIRRFKSLTFFYKKAKNKYEN